MMEITQKMLRSQVRPSQFVVLLISADSTATCSTLILYLSPVGCTDEQHIVGAEIGDHEGLLIMLRML